MLRQELQCLRFIAGEDEVRRGRWLQTGKVLSQHGDVNFHGE